MSQMATEQDASDPDRLATLYRTAREDVSVLMHELRQGDTQVRRRALVRAVFAFIESMTSALKREAHDSKAEFSPAECALLREEAYELSEQGEARVRPANTEFRRNVRFAFSAYARLTNTKPGLDVSEEGWHQLQQALRVRHRLMHPKRTADFTVDDGEIKMVIGAFQWFERSWAVALARSCAALVNAAQKQRGGGGAA